MLPQDSNQLKKGSAQSAAPPQFNKNKEFGGPARSSGLLEPGFGPPSSVLVPGLAAEGSPSSFHLENCSDRVGKLSYTSGGNFAQSSGKVLPLEWGNIFIRVGKFFHSSGKAPPLEWGTLGPKIGPLEWENVPTRVG